MSIIVVAEKPSVARDIAQSLGARKKREGYFEGSGYIVSWAVGHLVKLAEPHEMKESWKRWSFSELPMLPERWPLRVIKEASSQFKVLKELFKNDYDYAVCATDAGREGELIFRLIYEKLKLKLPVKRLWISSLTNESITKGFRNLRSWSDYDYLADAALARSRADWLVGMNFSRAYSLRYNNQFSLGRVQTPTLAMIVEKDAEIEKFTPEDYREIHLSLRDFEEEKAAAIFKNVEKLAKSYKVKRFFDKDKETLKEVFSRLKKSEFSVTNVDEKIKRIPPARYFDLTELQRHANKLYGFQAGQTLKIAQSLYEKHKLISYPRTDSRYISKDILNGLEDVFNSAKVYLGESADCVEYRQLSKRFVDDTKVSDHHAIIPTGIMPGRLNANEEKIYRLIVYRLLHSFMDDNQISERKVICEAKSEKHIDLYQAEGKKTIDLGWKKLSDFSKKSKQEVMIEFDQGDKLKPQKAEIIKKQTLAPSPFSDASLLTAMEQAGKNVDSEELSEALKERGLGTPATRSAIIDNLIARAYLERQQRTLRSTKKAQELIARVSEELKSPELTGEWEYKLKQMERGKFPFKKFMKSIEDKIAHEVNDLSQGVEDAKQEVFEKAKSLETMKLRDPVNKVHLKGLLKQVFGFSNFRPYQEAVCRDIVDGNDALLVMPTGAGKSLCYQLPGLAMGGATLVISPLIALMEDQEEKLKALGVRAGALHSGKPREESRNIFRQYVAGKLDFLLIAPERLGVPGFVEFLSQHKPSLIAIDEAHCISQWGHDFRPDYRMLKERLEPLRPATIVALTATATPLVQKDIVTQLGLDEAKLHINGFRRTNIAIENVEVSKSDRIDTLQQMLLKEERQPAIVYAPTRKQAESVADALGPQAYAYHAGMPAEKRSRIQTRFINGDIGIIVATVAFGMGIDKSDVRTVCHIACPSTLEGYYQEIGRAGRDGKLSRAILMHSFADQKTHEFFHKKNYPALADLKAVLDKIPKDGIYREGISHNLEFDDFEIVIDKLWVHGAIEINHEDVVKPTAKASWEAKYMDQKRHREAQMQLVFKYASNDRSCRMLQLMEHFGDPDAQGASCGICDVCSPDMVSLQKKRKVTNDDIRYLKSIFAAVDEVHEFSSGRVYRESVEGLGVSRSQFEKYVSLLISEQVIGQENKSFEKDGRVIEYKALYKKRSLDHIDFDSLTISAFSSSKTNKRKGASAKSRSGAKKWSSMGETYDKNLFNLLKGWRLAESGAKGVPAYRVLPDRSLVSLASLKPMTESELLEVHGIGPSKFEKYGKELLEMIKSECS